MDVLGIESAIMVGYSMGGPVAQLMWKRHPEKVDGLVLCATSHSFVPGVRERLDLHVDDGGGRRHHAASAAR